MDLVQTLAKVALLGSTWVLYALLALSVISIGLSVERWRFFARSRAAGRALRSELLRQLRDGKLAQAQQTLERDASLEAEALRAALQRRPDGPEAVAVALDGELAVLRPRLEQGLTLLGTIGNNAPFLGLFGTVIGVIEAFHHLGTGTDAAMGKVMAGIAEALIATAVGIFVALPAVAAYNGLQKRIADVEGEVQALGKLFAALLFAQASCNHTSQHDAPVPVAVAVPAASAAARPLHKVG